MSELEFPPHSRHTARYKDHSINSVCGNDRCLFGEVCGIHQYTVFQDAYNFEYSRNGTYTYDHDLKV
jgi:hypothetical protein